MTLRTITYDPAQYKLVPNASALVGFSERAAIIIDDFLMGVPDTLPGVIEHSGEPVAEVVSFVNGSYSRKYKLEWLNDVPEGTKLFTHPAPAQPVGPTIWPEWANYAAFDGNHVIFYAERPEIVGDAAVPAGGKWGGAVNFFVVDRPAYAAQPVSAGLTNKQIDDAIFAAACQSYAYVDDPEGYRTVIRALLSAAQRDSPPVAQSVCQTCSGNGMIGGPSYYQPDEGGEPCPDCSQPVADTSADARDAALTEIHKFLLGEGPLDGLWYGDVDTSKPRPRYWWRNFLRAAIATSREAG